MLEIRTAALEDMAVFLDWAADEGWNPGFDDAFPFHHADPDGFFIGYADARPVAAISVVCSGDNHAFLGFYICHPLYRGRGFGMALWQQGLRHAGSRTVGLDGVVAQQGNYAKSGFALAWNNVRYGGTLAAGPREESGIREVRAADLPALVAYDALHYGARRENFLLSWFSGASTRQSYISGSGGTVSGYCTVRRCRRGVKIGPLFAGSREVADALLSRAGQFAGGAEVFLDVPLVNAAAVTLAEERKLVPQFETARMYRGQAPSLPLNSIFGVTTFELG